MSTRLTRFVGALVLAPALVAGFTAVSPEPDPTTRAPLVLQDGLHLGEVMEGLKDNLKGLAQTVRDPAQQSAALEHVAAMQSWTLAGKALSAPEPASELEAEARAAYDADFRADMARLLIQLAELEVELLTGETDAAWERITGRVFELRETAHEKFQH